MHMACAGPHADTRCGESRTVSSTSNIHLLFLIHVSMRAKSSGAFKGNPTNGILPKYDGTALFIDWRFDALRARHHQVNVDHMKQSMERWRFTEMHHAMQTIPLGRGFYACILVQSPKSTRAHTYYGKRPPCNERRLPPVS
ncbi:hypothetical protein CIHG_06127 [Coccidioides immitis H538.4]|uniref:Uncharacterized protein n=3 Tax=Coccidioides immitis TaxID=5501 RepID=A0A0J8TQ42_COCIT|nr:hypothetical protein CIRG_00067 [Coccidioides immitis RMSCC 2394]KMU75852.1 hypothetical protein CISG_05249 [Coccidioides immitis RMSCC 3703]KMU88329.1 hypothetical protein CIHG_06127 [Coccidioides immitis H538.4]